MALQIARLARRCLRCAKLMRRYKIEAKERVAALVVTKSPHVALWKLDEPIEFRICLMARSWARVPSGTEDPGHVDRVGQGADVVTT